MEKGALGVLEDQEEAATPGQSLTLTPILIQMEIPKQRLSLIVILIQEGHQGLMGQKEKMEMLMCAPETMELMESTNTLLNTFQDQLSSTAINITLRLQILPRSFPRKMM